MFQICIFWPKKYDGPCQFGLLEGLDESLTIKATAAHLFEQLLRSPLDGLLWEGPEHGDVGDVDQLDEGADNAGHWVVETEENQHTQRHINCTDDYREGANAETVGKIYRHILDFGCI